MWNLKKWYKWTYLQNRNRLTDIETKSYAYRGFCQDGGVEGRALTPSCESTGITTNCWTITNRKTLEFTRKDIPHPKIKEKPQWDGRRGAITIKSNPITTGWVTNKLRTIIPQKSTLWSEGSEPHVRLPNLGVQQQEEEFPENETLKASGIWLQDFDKPGGHRDSTLGGHTQSSVRNRTKGEVAVTPYENEPDLPASVGGSPAEVGGGCGSPQGQGH